MGRTKFEPEAAKSILVFELAPITQSANYLFKFKSKDLELILKVLENNYEGNFFQLTQSHPKQHLRWQMLSNSLKNSCQRDFYS